VKLCSSFLARREGLDTKSGVKDLFRVGLSAFRTNVVVAMSCSGEYKYECA
jgi:hypothetical protein